MKRTMLAAFLAVPLLAHAQSVPKGPNSPQTPAPAAAPGPQVTMQQPQQPQQPQMTADEAAGQQLLMEATAKVYHATSANLLLTNQLQGAQAQIAALNDQLTGANKKIADLESSIAATKAAAPVASSGSHPTPADDGQKAATVPAVPDKVTPPAATPVDPATTAPSKG